MATDPTYAVLVGVDDYRVLDRSLGNPRGASNLRGAVNDVVAWIEVCRRLRIPDDQIRVLTWPQLTPAKLRRRGVRPGELRFEKADHATCVKAVQWLADTIGGRDDRAGILFWAGHNEVQQAKRMKFRNFPFLAVADTTATEEDGDLTLHNAVSLSNTRNVLKAAGAMGNLTTFIDACSSPRLPRVLQAAGSRRLRNEDAWDSFGDRTFSATTPNEPSLEAVFGGVWHGAFTWAATRALDQWRVVPAAGGMRSTVSHARLLQAIVALTKAFDYEQDAQFSGGRQLRRLPVFNIGSKAPPDATSDSPDRVQGSRQLSAGHLDFRIYLLNLGQTTASNPGNGAPTFGRIVVVGDNDITTPQGTFTKNTEYWRLDLSYISGGVMNYSGGYTMWLADCDQDAVAGNSGLQNVLNWTGGTAWSGPQAYDTAAASLTANATAACASSTNTDNRQITMYVNTGANKSGSWFATGSGTGLLFSSSSAASIETSQDGWADAFSSSDRIGFPSASITWTGATRYDGDNS